ncbi:hypothetical protein CUMW_220550, partial [Citrus unshiu]
AFGFTSSVKAKRSQMRATEKEQRRLHIPTIDRSYGEPPPYVVVVQEPPRQLQFVDCPNDINGMIDCAKIADLALLLIDASHGFEMETFEFLNLMQNHGLPKFMGVLTHLDKFKCTKTDICNLTKFISVKKFPSLHWRTCRPYVVVDRFEDVTPPERVHMNNKCDRSITIYGYLRGCNLKKGTKSCNLHGMLVSMTALKFSWGTGLADPCPLPSAAKKKGLRDKEKLFYAPMSGLGDLPRTLSI